LADPTASCQRLGRIPSHSAATVRAVSAAPDHSEVYTAPDGRPALFLRTKFLGSDGDGFLFVTQRGGLAVQWWASESEVSSMVKWKPVLPAAVAERLDRLESRTNLLSLEAEALTKALQTAIGAVDAATAERIRETYRRWRPRTA
jgi:hypothetical protein